MTTSLRGLQPTSQTHNFEYSSPKFGTGESGIQTNKQTIVNSDIVNKNINSLFTSMVMKSSLGGAVM